MSEPSIHDERMGVVLELGELVHDLSDIDLDQDDAATRLDRIGVDVIGMGHCVFNLAEALRG